MKRFVEGVNRDQATLFPECLEDWVEEDNPVRVIEAFVEGLDLGGLGFSRVDPQVTGRPSYHPSVLLKLYVYGYLNRVQSSRRLEREAGRNVEIMWLTGRLVPDHKTIADFRKDNGPAIRKVCAQFVSLCRELGLLTGMDVTGMEVFHEVMDLLDGHGITFGIARANRPITALLDHYGALDSIGRERLYPSNRNAMAAYRKEHPGNAVKSSAGKAS